jgi:accessory gene regulator protein AgrB
VPLLGRKLKLGLPLIIIAFVKVKVIFTKGFNLGVFCLSAVQAFNYIYILPSKFFIVFCTTSTKVVNQTT